MQYFDTGILAKTGPTVVVTESEYLMLQIPLLATSLSYTVHVIRIPQGQFRWDLWWTEWQCERYFSEHFGLPLPINIPLGLHNPLSPVACTLWPLAAAVLRHWSSTHNNICMYIGFRTFFYVVRHLDSIASYLPTVLHLGFFRAWPSLFPPSSFFFGLPRALLCFGIHFSAILGNLPSAVLWTWPYQADKVYIAFFL
jgi:hypothetical protein